VRRVAFAGHDDGHPVLSRETPLPVDHLRIFEVDPLAVPRLEDHGRAPRVLVVRLLVGERERRQDDPNADLVAAERP
jgi:hypothetical protein